MADGQFSVVKSKVLDDHFDAKTVAKRIKEWGFTDLPFTAAELLKYGM